LTCVAFASYSVLARSLSKQFSPPEISYFMLGLGFVTFLVASLAEHASANTLDRLFNPLASGTFLVSILFLGIASSLVTALSSNYILSKMEASKMSVFSNLSTIVSMLAGALFLDESITGYHVVGSVLIIAGVVGANKLGSGKSGVKPKPLIKKRVVRGQEN